MCKMLGNLGYSVLFPVRNTEYIGFVSVRSIILLLLFFVPFTNILNAWAQGRGGGVAVSLTADGAVHKKIALQWYSVLYLMACGANVPCNQDNSRRF